LGNAYSISGPIQTFASRFGAAECECLNHKDH
jgi:hypothetical protein